jgi:hypothetical protein
LTDQKGQGKISLEDNMKKIFALIAVLGLVSIFGISTSYACGIGKHKDKNAPESESVHAE